MHFLVRRSKSLVVDFWFSRWHPSRGLVGTPIALKSWQACCGAQGARAGPPVGCSSPVCSLPSSAARPLLKMGRSQGCPTASESCARAKGGSPSAVPPLGTADLRLKDALGGRIASTAPGTATTRPLSRVLHAQPHRPPCLPLPAATQPSAPGLGRRGLAPNTATRNVGGAAHARGAGCPRALAGRRHMRLRVDRFRTFRDGGRRRCYRGWNRSDRSGVLHLVLRVRGVCVRGWWICLECLHAWPWITVVLAAIPVRCIPARMVQRNTCECRSPAPFPFCRNSQAYW